MFCELLSIKEPQTKLQNKETTVQSYWKMPNQNIKKSPEIKLAAWIAHFILFLYLFLLADRPSSSESTYFMDNPWITQCSLFTWK